MLLGTQEFTIYMVRPLVGQVAYTPEGAGTTIGGFSQNDFHRCYRSKVDDIQFAIRCPKERKWMMQEAGNVTVMAHK